MQTLVILAEGKNGNCAVDRHKLANWNGFFSTLKRGELPHIPAN